MHFISVPLLRLIGVLMLAAPLAARAQRPDPSPSPAENPAPSTTQSQSGYPDVRKEAADPTLFPDPDRVATDLVRPKAANTVANAGIANQGQTKRGGIGRTNSQPLGQADTAPLPVRVAYRRAKTIAMEREPSLGTLLKRADDARTDVEKRQILRVYYAQLFAEVRKIDPSPAMKSHVDSLQVSTEQRYEPKRVGVSGEEDLINGRLFGRLNAGQ